MLIYNKTSSKGASYLGILVAVLIFAACAGTKKLKAEDWVDQEEGALVKSWGPPAQVVQSGKRKFVIYFSDASACRYTFEIKDNKIVDWAVKGKDCQ